MLLCEHVLTVLVLFAAAKVFFPTYFDLSESAIVPFYVYLYVRDVFKVQYYIALKDKKELLEFQIYMYYYI